MIVNDVYKEADAPATTFVPSDTLGVRLYGEVGCAYNPNRARDLLARAGFPNGDGLPQIVLMYNDEQYNRDIAAAIHRMWLAVLGVDIQLEELPWENYLSLLATDPPQIYRLAWGANYNDPLDFLEVFTSKSEYDYGHFQNSQYDTLVKKIAVETDKAKRIGLVVDAERILCETEAAVAPIFHFTSGD